MSTEERRVEQTKRRIERIMNACRHFTGVQHDTCKAGIAYDSVRPGAGGGLPCLKSGGECASVSFPTREEAEQEEAAHEVKMKKFSFAHRAAHDDAKAKKFGKGQGGSDSLPCPICTTGRIYYRVAGYNGHMHAKCETDGCVSWME